MKTEIIIDNWSCVGSDWSDRKDTYQKEPKDDEFLDLQVGVSLHGKVTGHSWIEDGHRVHSSKIVKIIEDGLVETESGSIYRLGEINPSYLTRTLK